MFRQLHHVARELVEFAWRMFTGHGTLQILEELQQTLAEENLQPFSLQVQDLFVDIQRHFQAPEAC